MNDLAATPIEYLKGVGPQKAVLLQNRRPLLLVLRVPFAHFLIGLHKGQNLLFRRGKFCVQIIHLVFELVIYTNGFCIS